MTFLRSAHVAEASGMRHAARQPSRVAAMLTVIAGGTYPWLLQLAYAVAQRTGSGAAALAARSVIATALMFATPAAGLWLSTRLSTPGTMTLGDARLRAIATLALASPPLFTLLGVETWLAGIAQSEGAIWLVLWSSLAVAAWRAAAQDEMLQPRRLPSAAWRVTHGVVAALLLAGFIAMHLANHLGGLRSAETHLRLMHTLRAWYRAPAVEPVLILLCVVQLVTGAVLARRWLARPIDEARALQSITGAYLGLYLVCHLNSTFVYARANGIDTDFWFASGGVGGLMADAWNVRLVPHYALAVVFLFVHLAAGLRVVLLAHGLRPYWLPHLIPAAWITGALIAAGAVLPLLRIHLN